MKMSSFISIPSIFITLLTVYGNVQNSPITETYYDELPNHTSGSEWEMSANQAYTSLHPSVYTDQVNYSNLKYIFPLQYPEPKTLYSNVNTNTNANHNYIFFTPKQIMKTKMKDAFYQFLHAPMMRSSIHENTRIPSAALVESVLFKIVSSLDQEKCQKESLNKYPIEKCLIKSVAGEKDLMIPHFAHPPKEQNTKMIPLPFQPVQAPKLHYFYIIDDGNLKNLTDRQKRNHSTFTNQIEANLNSASSNPTPINLNNNFGFSYNPLMLPDAPVMVPIKLSPVFVPVNPIYSFALNTYRTSVPNFHYSNPSYSYPYSFTSSINSMPPSIFLLENFVPAPVPIHQPPYIYYPFTEVNTTPNKKKPTEIKKPVETNLTLIEIDPVNEPARSNPIIERSSSGTNDPQVPLSSAESKRRPTGRSGTPERAIITHKQKYTQKYKVLYHKQKQDICFS